MDAQMDAPGSLEAVQTRHRKENRELVARLTQKKKSATKKTRKGVNDECDRLEQELKERHHQELAAFDGSDDTKGLSAADEPESLEEQHVNGVVKAVEGLTLSAPTQPSGANDTQPQPDGPKKKPNRAKARLARRAAEQEALASQAADEAADLPDLRKQERARMREHFDKYDLEEKEIRADGHCLYAAVADQMDTRGLGLKPRITATPITTDTNLPPYKMTRYAAADVIARNPDDFVPFMEEPLDQYLQKIRDTGEWGGHLELTALAKAYGVKIKVLHGDGRVDVIEPNESNPDAAEIWIGYYRHGFGLGEHYNSLRSKA